MGGKFIRVRRRVMLLSREDEWCRLCRFNCDGIEFGLKFTRLPGLLVWLSKCKIEVISRWTVEEKAQIDAVSLDTSLNVKFILPVWWRWWGFIYVAKGRRFLECPCRIC